MGSEWFKNMCGMSLTDEEMKNIPYTTTEVGIHVTAKTVQTFGLLGTLVVGPIVALIRKNTRNWPAIKHNMTRTGRRGLILGLAAGPLMTYQKLRNEEEERIWDRCYRLRYNRGQIRVDQDSLIGAALGLGIGAATGSGALFGGLVGMSSGVIIAAANNNIGKK